MVVSVFYKTYLRLKVKMKITYIPVLLKLLTTLTTLPPLTTLLGHTRAVGIKKEHP